MAHLRLLTCHIADKFKDTSSIGKRICYLCGSKIIIIEIFKYQSFECRISEKIFSSMKRKRLGIRKREECGECCDASGSGIDVFDFPVVCIECKQ